MSNLPQNSRTIDHGLWTFDRLNINSFSAPHTHGMKRETAQLSERSLPNLRLVR